MKKATKISLITLSVILAVGLLVASFGLAIAFNITKNEKFQKEKLVNPNLKIEVYDNNNNLISDKNMFNNQYIKISDLNAHTLDAFVSIEDKNFYSHNGINIKRMGKALIKNLSKGRAVEGASTISQQLIKNTHLSSEKTYSRKLKEISLALQMEKNLTKDQILENYLNVIYYGNNIYGIENASQFYFSKPASQLTLEESATLAGIIKSPANYCPINNPEKCKKRRNLVLSEMEKDGVISAEMCQKAKESELKININENFNRGQNSYSQAAIEEATKILNMPAKQIALGGFKIYTFYNESKQQALKEAVDAEGLGFDQAAISINNKTHGIEAFYANSPYSVLNVKRSPGSTIKPLLVYGPAFNENIITPATKILDEEININGYSPKNFNKLYDGHISVRDSVAKSSNVPAVKTLSYVGIEKAKRYGQRLGIEFDPRDSGYALALGGMTYGTDIKTLASAYTTLANNGEFAECYFISKIEDKDGKTIYQPKFVPDQVFREDSNYLNLSTLLTGVESGTSKKLNTLPYMVAGKTGTVGIGDTHSDIYSVALTTEDTVLTWVGDLSSNNIGKLVGGKEPTEMIKTYFNSIYSTHTPEDFTVPSSISTIEIDALEYQNNHTILKANEYTPERYKLSEVFSKFNLPKEKSTNFLEVTPATLNGKIVNKNYVFEFDASNYLTYELYREEADGDVLVKTFEGQSGTTSYTLPQQNQKTKFYLITKIKNHSTGQEVSSEKSNIIEFVGKETTSTPISQNKWYL